MFIWLKILTNIKINDIIFIENKLRKRRFNSGNECASARLGRGRVGSRAKRKEKAL